MGRARRRFSAQFKAKVALDAVRGQKTAAELAGEHGVHVSQIAQGKKQLLESLPEVFGRKREVDAADREALTARLHQEIGQLKVELDWLKKSRGLRTERPTFDAGAEAWANLPRPPVRAVGFGPQHGLLPATVRG